MSEILTFLETQRMNAPERLQPLLYTMEDLWERRLWHQLTEVLVKYFQDGASAPSRMSMYTAFVSSFEDKINQLKLVMLGQQAARQCASSEEALLFLGGLAQKVDTRQTQDAHVYVLVEIARVRLLKGEIEEVKTMLDRISKTIDSFDTVEGIIHAAYYQVTADFYKAKADYAGYYRNSLRYLACINIKELSEGEMYERAHDLSIAALMGDTIYNFGELLLHPVLDALAGTQRSWLKELLFVVNAGNISRFEGLSGHFVEEHILQDALPFLRQKICLTALTEAVFKRAPNERILEFGTIAEETGLVREEVEHLVMKALSVGLLRGSMDEVLGIVEVTWVQCRVLNAGQIGAMAGRFRDWVAQVAGVAGAVRSEFIS